MPDNLKIFDNHQDIQLTPTTEATKVKNISRPLHKNFKIQESIITDLIDNNANVQAIYSFSSALIWSYVLIQFLFNRQQLKNDISFINWALFTNFHLLLLMWFEILTLFFLVYPVTKLYIKKHISGNTYSGLLFGLFAVSKILIHHPSLTFKLEITNVGLFALLLEQTRMTLKTFALALDARNKVIDRENCKEMHDKEPSICSFSHFLYYHFAPVIVFRDFYPRSTKQINWGRIVQWSSHVIGCIYLLCLLIRRFVIPQFSKVGKEGFSTSDIEYTTLCVYWTAVLIHFAGGYGLLHCWMNIWAELLSFGDKNFSHDWWTATNCTDYLRKWNLIVGDFIFECMYLPLMTMTRSRYLSAFVVYTLSAVVHDYMAFGLLGFFVPAFTLLYPFFATIGDLSVLCMNKLGIFTSISRIYGNTLIFLSSYFFFSIWLGIPFLEFFARRNCPEILDGSWSEAVGLSLKFPKCINMTD